MCFRYGGWCKEFRLGCRSSRTLSGFLTVSASIDCAPGCGVKGPSSNYTCGTGKTCSRPFVETEPAFSGYLRPRCQSLLQSLKHKSLWLLCRCFFLFLKPHRRCGLKPERCLESPVILLNKTNVLNTKLALICAITVKCVTNIALCAWIQRCARASSCKGVPDVYIMQSIMRLSPPLEIAL